MKAFSLALLITLSIFASPLFAEGETEADTSTLAKSLDAQKYTFRIGETAYFYQEPSVMKIHGEMSELGAAYQRGIFLSRVNMYFGANLNYAFGKQLYNGSLMVTHEPVVEHSIDRIWNFEAYYGFFFLNSPVQTLKVYAGPGVWYLHNKIDGGGSYTRQITYYYLQAGADYVRRLGEAWTFSGGLQLMGLVIGTVQSSFGETDPNNPTVYNTQESGAGAKVKTSMTWNHAKVSPYAELYYRYWHIAESTVNYGLVEPDNNTQIIGLNLGAHF